MSEKRLSILSSIKEKLKSLDKKKEVEVEKVAETKNEFVDDFDYLPKFSNKDSAEASQDFPHISNKTDDVDTVTEQFGQQDSGEDFGQDDIEGYEQEFNESSAENSKNKLNSPDSSEDDFDLDVLIAEEDELQAKTGLETNNANEKKANEGDDEIEDFDLDFNDEDLETKEQQEGEEDKEAEDEDESGLDDVDLDDEEEHEDDHEEDDHEEEEHEDDHEEHDETEHEDEDELFADEDEEDDHEEEEHEEEHEDEEGEEEEGEEEEKHEEEHDEEEEHEEHDEAEDEDEDDLFGDEEEEDEHEENEEEHEEEHDDEEEHEEEHEEEFEEDEEDEHEEQEDELKQEGGLGGLTAETANLLKPAMKEQVENSLQKLQAVNQVAENADNILNDSKLQGTIHKIIENKIETWLNNNLPLIVENIVASEIAKIIKK